jgi:glycosyltransferase involved in cell wall biosynthesis
LVLTAHERAYERISQEQMGEIGADVIVDRAFALDTARHLSAFGRYPMLLAIPDRWITWLLGGVWAGLQLVRKHRPAVIWSTYPIATAHLIGYALHRLTGLPWIADLRDPMAQQGYPENPLQWRAFKWIEDKIALYASAICFTSPGAIEEFVGKHRDAVDKQRLHLIENGYDEDCFSRAEALYNSRLPAENSPLVLVHSGIVYPSERDPRPFFDALAKLKQAGLATASTLQIIFRASGHDDYLAQLIAAAGLQDIIKLAPALPYIEALSEMLAADGLILLQAPNCNYQIPAKLYEYIRAGRPIFGITDHVGDTAKILLGQPNTVLADITSSEDIASNLQKFIGQLNKPVATIADAANTERFSRRKRTMELVDVINSILL